MRDVNDIFVPGSGVLYGLDARIKIVVLVTFSVAVFFVETWAGLGLLFAFVFIAAFLGRLPLARLASMASPVLVLLSVIVLCNSLTSSDGSASLAHISGVSAGFAEGLSVVPLCGSLAFSPEGFMKGLFYLVRIVLVVWASFVVIFSTKATQLTRAFSSLLGPLRPLRFPVDDAAMVCSLVLRFIPLTWSSYTKIVDAQVSRGACYGDGGLWARVRGHLSLMVPLFVSVFRGADRLAQAMDARCYGLVPQGGSRRRTSLERSQVSMSDVLVLLCSLVFLFACSIAL